MVGLFGGMLGCLFAFNDCVWRVWMVERYCVTVNSVVLLHCCSCDWFCVIMLVFVWWLVCDVCLWFGWILCFLVVWFGCVCVFVKVFVSVGLDCGVWLVLRCLVLVWVEWVFGVKVVLLCGFGS